MPIEITTASSDLLSSLRLALQEPFNIIPSTSAIQPFGGNNNVGGQYSAILGGQNNSTNNLPNTFILGSNIVASVSSFTFVENLSSKGVVRAAGGNSSNWNSSYSTVNSNSATNWNYQGTDLKNLSAGWVGGNSAYTTTKSNSANWTSSYTTTNSNSAVWNSAYTTVNSNSSNWDYQGTDLKNLSSDWVGGNSAYTTTNSNSSNWNNAYDISTTYQNTSSAFATNTTLNSVSSLLTPLVTTSALTGQLVTNATFVATTATLLPTTTYQNTSGLFVQNTTISNLTGNWNTAYASTTSLNLSSGTWNGTYSTVNSNSATTWNYQGTDLKALSSGWVGGNSAYTTVNSNSSTWGIAGNTSTFTTVNSNSANWSSVYTTVNSNSATTWNYQGTDLKALSSGWVGGNSAYTTVNSGSGNWNTAYSTTTAFSVSSNGNVGIGTSSPISKLTVVGDISATGALYGSNQPFTGILLSDGSQFTTSEINVFGTVDTLASNSIYIFEYNAVVFNNSGAGRGYTFAVSGNNTFSILGDARALLQDDGGGVSSTLVVGTTGNRIVIPQSSNVNGGKTGHFTVNCMISTSSTVNVALGITSSNTGTQTIKAGSYRRLTKLS